MTFYVTFGQGHFAGLLRDKYIRIEVDEIARTPGQCRDRAFACMDKHFGKWSTMYPEGKFDASMFPSGMLACIDEHGNRLFSKEA